MSSRQFRKGDVLFRPGDPSDRAYLIESGEVEILDGFSATPSRLALLGPGEVFGEMSLVEERAHEHMAVALSAGSASTLTRTEFERDLLQNPERCHKYLIRLFERIRSLTSRLGAPSTVARTPALAGALLTLYPLSEAAANVLPEEGLALTRFPFRVGRASEPNEPEPSDLNDLWLLDSRPFNVSRNHLAIDLWGEGRFVVKDRGSLLGTIVNGDVIGGKSHDRRAELREGENRLIVGSELSPYQIRVVVQRKQE